MTDFSIVTENLKREGFAVSCFPTGAAAADYLDGCIDGKSVAFGGSVTLRDMGVYEKLASHNEVCWHWMGDDQKNAAGADVFLTSVNGLAQTGELINIDGCGNRVSSSLYGHKKVYFVVGRNKLAPDFEGALWRARNIAAPKNAQRLGRKTPCALKGDRCYDCDSPERICRGLVVLWRKMTSCEQEVVLVDEALGY